MRNLILLLASVVLLTSCETKKPKRFKLLNPSDTGIDFNNLITENDSINVFKYMNIYTGAGVAVGDVNNDGLTDVYFSGNMVSGRLYLNKGDLKFEDISKKAGLLNNSWGTGASIIDINQDGFLDIYIAVSGGAEESKRANLLYINNGPSSNSGEITFTEKAKEYGLADTRQSMHSAFFDYDKDGDLDLYLLVNPAAYEHQVNSSNPRKLDGKSISNDRLYRNEGNGKFTDVSLEAGILVEGYGLGVAISDINNDSWPDIYISNDFVGNDILYINKGDGTFKDEITEYMNHTSYAGMGNGVSDIDNNGKPDIMVLDMRPEDNERQKLIISSTGYDRFQMMLNAGYQAQYSRNTMQLNMGEGEFSEIGNMAGISSTDWSWSTLLADYDNDGYKDIYITNGFLRDLGNLDYIHYQNIYDNPLGEREAKINQKLKSIQELPPAKLVNYSYRNSGNTTFEDTSEDWGIVDASCSNGAAYADLDNDGDLDLVVNNVNQPAFVYENRTLNDTINHYLRIQLIGKQGNLQGIGAKVKITTKTSTQFEENFLSRGYESSTDPILHFGLGKENVVERIEIWWPDNSYQNLTGIKADQQLLIKQTDQVTLESKETISQDKTWFKSTTEKSKIDFNHIEDGMIDFKIQPILPHMASRNGPGIAVGDYNADGLEDFYVGGGSGQFGEFFVQNKDATFSKSTIPFDVSKEDLGSLFFDANNDGYLDLYIVSGGVLLTEDFIYQDRLYLNDGSGNFFKSDALPQIKISGSTVNAVDFDHDGDLDLFVGGRVNPGKYPMPVKSYLLENLANEDAENIKFRDISNQISDWDKLTMVTSALWTDYDSDGWSDLIVVGEFMQVEFFHNEKGKLIRATNTTGLKKTEGWWNSINGGDFDGDGDIDYIIGNQGLNNKFKASENEPLSIYANDYDKDGRIDPIMCYYNDGENYIAHSRDELIGQISAMRLRFKTYKSYAETPFEKSFLPEELENAYVVKSHNFASSYVENLGNGSFKISDLPIAAQMAPIEGIVIEDFNQDGNQDVILTGNSYSTDVATGRYDALKGLVLKGKGNGSFETLSLKESGFINDFDGSGLASIRNNMGDLQIIAANNNGPLNIFTINSSEESIEIINAEKETLFAEIFFENGKKVRKEFYYGSGYLSNSSRSIQAYNKIKEIKFTDVSGKTKTVFSKSEIK
ncbi:VCBS repeat-containing protein [Zobellia laminariae]|uniref:VCBS repeat-containing protein n=1 Tax=Zobellia laminariae TaxID=248906 RepID=UPI0026F4541C|nr:VCBS repeat-containing protein [Zobellia laminariae]WKX77694.1 VCBS repeat-containing protein [Zobellia laminariae]